MVACPVRLEGRVLWVSPTRDRIILQDDGGGAAINVDVSPEAPPEIGQRVLLKAWCSVGRNQVNVSGVVNNDYLHALQEKSGTCFLQQGLNPIRVEWFNGASLFALEVTWSGPRMSRQPIPSSALFRAQRKGTANTNSLAPGLDYFCYEGAWEHLPDFSSLPIVKRGTVTNFDISVQTRPTNAGVVFEGFLDVPETGPYTFWTKSDDGSKLFVGPSPLLKFPDPPTLPLPRQLTPGQTVSEPYDCQWTEVEGLVSFVNESGAPSLELSSSVGRTHLQLTGASGGFWKHLLGCRIKARGVCQNASSVDDQMSFSILVPSLQYITIMEMAPAYWIDHPVVPISQAQAQETAGALIHISGTVCSNGPGPFMVIQDQGGQIGVQTAQELPPVGETVEALGQWRSADQGGILENGFYRRTSQATNATSPLLPLLTQAIQVKRLNRTEAQRGYPIRLRGVITAPIGPGFAMQDSTWSLYFRPDTAFDEGEGPKVGDCWEIEGVTSLRFAPCIQVSSARRIGRGLLPEPIQPTWDKLINGSLDTQYIEIQGFATEVADTNGLLLLTREGKLNVQFPDLDPGILPGFKHALLRIRGVTSPQRDEKSLQMILAHLRLFNASISVEQPPILPSEVPLQRVSELLFFDVRANALRQIRVAGQIISQWHGDYFLMDGTSGLRFRAHPLGDLHIGDLVEVVGFPDLTGPSPALREAQARRTGSATLPAPQRLSEDTLLDSKLDSTLVRVEALVVSSSVHLSELMLDLKTGNRGFVGRLHNAQGIFPDISPGTHLELTGTYVGRGGDLTAGREINSFEILLNSPADIRVLARPSWWTARHALIVIGSMVLVLLVAAVWISLLHRQVQKHAAHLAGEIQSRQQLEHQRALEEERSRIARDLHDDLGATLTQIRFLSAVGSRDSLVPETTRTQLKQVSEKSRQMVASLDEIVWAVNPANDSLSSLANYLRHVAEEFFSTTAVSCRLDIDMAMPELPLTSEVRHNLYLAVREALNNSAKHAHATELWLRLSYQERILRIVVEDNGCGFVGPDSAAGQNGLLNMKRRLEKIGGRFECETHPGSGTICRMSLPLA